MINNLCSLLSHLAGLHPSGTHGSKQNLKKHVLLLLDPRSGFQMPNNTRTSRASQCSTGTQIATSRDWLYRGGGKTAGRRRGGNGWWARKWDSSCPNHKSESVSFHCRSLKCINEKTHIHTLHTQPCISVNTLMYRFVDQHAEPHTRTEPQVCGVYLAGLSTLCSPLAPLW